MIFIICNAPFGFNQTISCVNNDFVLKAVILHLFIAHKLAKSGTIMSLFSAQCFFLFPVFLCILSTWLQNTSKRFLGVLKRFSRKRHVITAMHEHGYSVRFSLSFALYIFIINRTLICWLFQAC